MMFCRGKCADVVGKRVPGYRGKIQPGQSWCDEWVISPYDVKEEVEGFMGGSKKKYL